MFGSVDLKGAFHTVKEIVGNALDEARSGYGDRIIVTKRLDRSISVRDFGRGVPMSWNEKAQRWNWDLVFNELYAGGKYNEGQYRFSVGLNGLGATAVQYASEYFEATSFRDKRYFMRFEAGFSVTDLDVQPLPDGETGTEIIWKIDEEVFPDCTNIPFSMIREYCQDQAHLNSITFILKDDETGEELEIEGKGIENYLDTIVTVEKIHSMYNKSTADGTESGKAYTTECEVALVIAHESERNKIQYYHNTANITVGVHVSAFENAVADFFRSKAKTSGVSLVVQDYHPYVNVVVSSYSNITSYAGQTKDGVSNIFVYNIIYNTVKNLLENAYAMKKIDDLVEEVISNARIRIEAKEFAKQRRQIASTISRSKQKPEKFVDCKSTNPRERELYIVEGISALGACQNSRDGRFQALLPITGKPLNCLKSDIDTILKNQVITNIVNTLGCGVDTVEGHNLFDLSRLQYDKIIICTDADVDGYQIRVLLYTLFYRLMPELLREGYIYVVESPLYELETTQGSYFAYNNADKDRLQSELQSKGIIVKKIHRSKGLGENNADMMWETTMNPETRKLVQLDIDPSDEVVSTISNMLFGTDINKDRKGFVFDIISKNMADLMETVPALEVNEDEEELAG
jgi:DNA gyrase subunit B